MWNSMARALGLQIPAEQLEKISPVLDSLWAQTRRALDRDLSRIDPPLHFSAEIGATP